MTPSTNSPAPRTDNVFNELIASLAGFNLPAIIAVKISNARKATRTIETELSQLRQAYQKSVQLGLKLKEQRDKWRKDAEKLYPYASSYGSHPQRNLDDDLINTISAHTALEQEEGKDV